MKNTKRKALLRKNMPGFSLAKVMVKVLVQL